MALSNRIGRILMGLLFIVSLFLVRDDLRFGLAGITLALFIYFTQEESTEKIIKEIRKK